MVVVVVVEEPLEGGRKPTGSYHTTNDDRTRARRG